LIFSKKGGLQAQLQRLELPGRGAGWREMTSPTPRREGWWREAAFDAQPFDPDRECKILKVCRLGDVPLDRLDRLMRGGEDPYMRDSFGDNAFSFCARCHKNAAFKFLYEHPAHALAASFSRVSEGSARPGAGAGELSIVDGIARGAIDPGAIMGAGGIRPEVIAAFHGVLDTLPGIPEPKLISLHLFLDRLEGVCDIPTLLHLYHNGAIVREIRVPIIDAAWSNNLEILDYLHRRRESVDQRDAELKSALMVAAKVGQCNGHRESNFLTIRRLLEYGADPNATDLLGRTPGMYAAQEGCGPPLALIYRAGGDLAAVDRQGKSLLKHINPWRGDIPYECTESVAGLQRYLNKLLERY
jgi:hypothetical protein